MLSLDISEQASQSVMHNLHVKFLVMISLEFKTLRSHVCVFSWRVRPNTEGFFFKYAI